MKKPKLLKPSDTPPEIYELRDKRDLALLMRVAQERAREIAIAEARAAESVRAIVEANGGKPLEGDFSWSAQGAGDTVRLTVVRLGAPAQG